MRLIISPAKKMRVDTDSFPCLEQPQFLPQTQRLLDQLRQLSPQQLKSSPVRASNRVEPTPLFSWPIQT